MLATIHMTVAPTTKCSLRCASDSIMPLPKCAKITASDAAIIAAPVNPDFPNLAPDADADDEDIIPEVGHAPDDMAQELERLMEEKDHMDVAE